MGLVVSLTSDVDQVINRTTRENRIESRSRGGNRLLSLLRRAYRSIPITKDLVRINSQLEYVMERLMGLEYVATNFATNNKTFLIENYRLRLVSEDRYRNPKKLNRFERQVFSQNGEDGIIEEIFKRIGVHSQTFLEIGVGDGLENNSVFLLFQDWHGYWIESDEKLVDIIHQRFEKPLNEGRLKVSQSFVKAENIEGILLELQVPNELDFVSLDIDRNTYWVWPALLKLRPRVAVVEYNGSLPPSVDWKVKYSAEGIWNGTIYFGASLKAYELLGRQHGYNLVGCDLNGVNAFFVREDLCQDKFEEPFTSEHHFEPLRLFLVQRIGYPACFSEERG